MKKNIQSILKMSALAFVASAFVFSCSDDDDNKDNAPAFTGESKTYTLVSTDEGNVSGTAIFREREDGSTVVTLDLDGTVSGQSYPVYIRSNSTSETGDNVIELEAVDGSTGLSTTVIHERDDGAKITYEDILAFDGSLIITTSDETVVSQTDIGSNELTATSRTYTLTSVGDSDVAGTVTFAKRMDGNTLVTTNLTGTTTGTDYPVVIYNNAMATPGTAAINLNTISGSTGASAMSTTNVSSQIGGTAITYDQLNSFNGHIGVGAAGSYSASTNIGANALP